MNIAISLLLISFILSEKFILFDFFLLKETIILCLYVAAAMIIGFGDTRFDFRLHVKQLILIIFALGFLVVAVLAGSMQTEGDWLGGLRHGGKILFYIVLVMLLIECSRFDIKKYMDIYTGFAIFFSASSIIFYITSVLLDYNCCEFELMWNSSGGVSTSYGLLSLMDFGARLQYYFSEPSKFAIFLLPAIWMRIGEIKRFTLNAVASDWRLSILAIAFILTGSFAGYLSIVVSIIYYFYAKPKAVRNFFILISIPMVAYLAYEIFVRYFTEVGGLSFFYRQPSYDARGAEFELIQDIVKVHPNGVAFDTKYFGNDYDVSFTLAPLDDIYRGGWLYLGFKSFFYFYILYILFSNSSLRETFDLSLINRKAILSGMLSIFAMSIFYGPTEQRIFLTQLILSVYVLKKSRTTQFIKCNRHHS